MSSRKTIAINPELFSMTGGKKKKEKAKTLKKKDKKFNFVNPNQLRKNLLSKIKEHRDNKETEQKQIPPPQIKEEKKENIEKFSSNFNDSMNYLSDLVEKEKKSGTKSKRKKRNRTLKRRKGGGNSDFDHENIEVNLKLPTDFTSNVAGNSEGYNNVSTILPPVPPYGCLKGGSQPTFRQWKTSTQKNLGFTSDDDDEDVDGDEDDDFVETLKEIQKDKSEPTDTNFTKPMINIEKSIPTERENKLNNLREKKGGYVTKKTLKRKYKLGKSKKNNSISVLIKSTQTKKKVMDEKKKIENEDISKIKKYLREHNLIRIGSTTPNDVLKTMYESAILSGYVNNNSDDVMLHNYLNNSNY
jgi:hypothetical protein